MNKLPWRAFVVAGVVVAAMWLKPSMAAEPAAWDIVAEARVAAGEDDHRRSIDLYLTAIEMKPAVLSQVAIELAHQYTWAELPDSAIYWYEYVLLGHPDNFDARLGIGRALAWGDRLEEAVAYYEALLPQSGARRNDVLVGLAKVKSWQQDEAAAERMYREVLAADPKHHDARLGLAEIMIWSDRPRKAQRIYEEMLAEDPNDEEAIKGLAMAQSAAGRSDVALRTLESGGDELSGERESIDSRGAVRNSNTFLFRDNTTDGDYRALVVDVNIMATNLTRLGAEYTVGRMRQDGRPDIARNQIMLPFQQRLSETLALTLSPGYQWNAFDPVVVPPATAPVDNFDLFVWDAYVTITPVDWVRVDAGNGRQTLTIPQSVFEHVHLTTTTGGLDWRLSQRVVTFLAPSYRTYSDGNSRFAVGERVEWTPPVRVPIDERNEIILYQNLEYMNFEQQLDNGYFNPDSWIQLLGGLRWITDIGSRLNLNIAGAMGSEKEEGGDWASTGSFEVEVAWEVGRNSSLRAGFVHSGSRLAAADGFRSTGFFVSFDITLPR
jgi:tetratricopeptide (TPR) repeat protein